MPEHHEDIGPSIQTLLEASKAAEEAAVSAMEAAEQSAKAASATEKALQLLSDQSANNDQIVPLIEGIKNSANRIAEFISKLEMSVAKASDIIADRTVAGIGTDEWIAIAGILTVVVTLIFGIIQLKQSSAKNTAETHARP